MKIGTSILCCVVFVFAFSTSAVVEIWRESAPEQCIPDTWNTSEEQHVQIQRCMERLSAADDERPADDCAFGHCGTDDDWQEIALVEN